MILACAGCRSAEGGAPEPSPPAPTADLAAAAPKPAAVSRFHAALSLEPGADLLAVDQADLRGKPRPSSPEAPAAAELTVEISEGEVRGRLSGAVQGTLDGALTDGEMRLRLEGPDADGALVARREQAGWSGRLRLSARHGSAYWSAAVELVPTP